jgi:hypothetical protein
VPAAEVGPPLEDEEVDRGTPGPQAQGDEAVREASADEDDVGPHDASPSSRFCRWVTGAVSPGLPRYQSGLLLGRSAGRRVGYHGG